LPLLLHNEVYRLDIEIVLEILHLGQGYLRNKEPGFKKGQKSRVHRRETDLEERTPTWSNHVPIQVIWVSGVVCHLPRAGLGVG